jgi:hypothetical protein
MQEPTSLENLQSSLRPERAMLRNHTLVPTIIDPEELVMLQRVFDKVCVRRGVAKDTPEATGIAEILIGIFQSGMRRGAVACHAVGDTFISMSPAYRIGSNRPRTFPLYVG